MTTNEKRDIGAFVRRVHHKYWGTEVYTAAVVTMILILQIYWMTKGSH